MDPEDLPELDDEAGLCILVLIWLGVLIYFAGSVISGP